MTKVEALRSEVQGLLSRHPRPDALPDVNPHGAGDQFSTAIPSLFVTRRSRPSDEEYHRFFPPALAVIVHGSILASVGGEPIREYDASTFVVTSLDLPTVSRIATATTRRPFLSVMLTLSMIDVASIVAEESLPKAPPDLQRTGGSYWQASITTELLAAVLNLTRLLDEPAAIPFLAPLRTREVIYRILTGSQGGRLRAMALHGGRSRQVARVIELLKADLSRPVYVEELATAANMSVTSFHRHFKELTTLSPMQYQKRLRLLKARRLMLADGSNASQAAERVGYQSTMQFNRDYRRLFGRPPRRDVAASTSTT